MVFATTSTAQYTFPPGTTIPIQALLDGPPLPTGSTITLQAGTYHGTIDFKNQPVTIQGAGPLVTIIDGNFAPTRVITFQNSEGLTSVLRNLQVRGGGGGGVLIDSVATPRIENCIVRDNVALQGAGINVLSASPLGPAGPNAEIVNCKFYANFATQAGGGASVFGQYSGGVSARFEECEFTGNSAPIGAGVYVSLFIGPTFERCVVEANVAGTSGGGAFVSSCAFPSFLDCALVANIAGDGGGFAFEEPGACEVLHCTLADNRATGVSPASGRGGAIFGLGQSAACDTMYMHNLLLTGNIADVGGAAYLGNFAPRMSFVTATANQGLVSCGGIVAENLPGIVGDCTGLELRNSILWNNSGLAAGSSDVWSKELWAQTCSTLVTSCDIEGALSSANPPTAWISTNLQEHVPHFVHGYTCKFAPVGSAFLSQSPLQAQPWSRCINAAFGQAATTIIAGRSTRTDGVADSGRPDLGFHYPSPGCP